MFPSAPHHLVLLLLQVSALFTLGTALVVLRWHAWHRKHERVLDQEVQVLAFKFARYLTHGGSVHSLRRSAMNVRPVVFWRALEDFADNVSGEEWTRLSAELQDAPRVSQEREKLADKDAWHRALAARHLGMLDLRDALAPLRQAMKRGPALVTLTSALALARLRDRSAVRWLLAHPKATADFSRHQLVALLKRFGFEAVPDLRQTLYQLNDEMPIHLAVVEVLGLRQDAESALLLEKLLKNGGLEARVASARALGAIRSARCLQPLCDALGDPVWQVRAQAALALGRLGDESAIAHLVARTSDVSWWVRRHSAYALAQLGAKGRAALHHLVSNTEDRFALEMAFEVLQALEWDQVSPGGVARVE